MNKKILMALSACTMAFAACDDDYDDWAAPQSNPQNEIISFGNGSVAAVGAIDFATVTTDSVQVCTITAPTASDASYAPRYQIVLGGESAFDITPAGLMSADELRTYVETTFGRRPTDRTIDAVLSMWVSNGTTDVRTESAAFRIVARPVAPEISAHYYIIGQPAGPSGWDPTCTLVPFSHSGADVYDDPIFTVTFSADSVSDSGDMWFAVIDDKTIEQNDWSYVFGAREGNGKNLVGEEGKIARRSELTDEGSFLLKPDGAKVVRMTLNMLDGTYKIDLLNFNEFVYTPGAHNGWSQGASIKLYGAGFDGKYTGHTWLDGEFKISALPNWDGPNYGDGGEGKLSTEGGNLTAKAGFYYIEADLAALTYKLTATTWGIIGDATADGWNSDVDMVYDADGGFWYALDVPLTAGEIKFRANDDWAINVGGTTNKLEANGANIKVAEAGTYDVVLYLSNDAESHCELTKK